MTALSPAARKVLEATAERHAFGVEAAAHMLDALRRGNASMAQFDHAEFAGAGQWMRGGMTMVGDMFDHGLKARVDSLCAELSALLTSEPALADAGGLNSRQRADTGRMPRGGDWWPSGLQRPVASGAQNGMRYAYFAAERRLAIERAGAVTIYDTLDHRIGGAAQQQAATDTLTFTSQHGSVDVAALPVIGPAERSSGGGQVSTMQETPRSMSPSIVALIAQLADLHDQGVLTDDEFSTKKAQLLARL